MHAIKHALNLEFAICNPVNKSLLAQTNIYKNTANRQIEKSYERKETKIYFFLKNKVKSKDLKLFEFQEQLMIDIFTKN